MQAEKTILADFPAQTAPAVVPLHVFYAGETVWVVAWQAFAKEFELNARSVKNESTKREARPGN